MKPDRRFPDSVAVYWEQYAWGGTDTHLLNLISAWPRPDTRFTIFSNNGNQGLERIESQLAGIPGVIIVRFHSYSTVRHLSDHTNRLFSCAGRVVNHAFFPFSFSAMILQAYRLLKQNGPFSALLADNGAYPAAWGCLAAVIAAKRLGIPERVLLVHHEAAKVEKWRRPVDRFIDRRVFKAATRLVAVSRATLESLVRCRFLLPEDRVQVIHNGVDLNFFDQRCGVTPTFSLAAMAPDADAIRIGMLGRIETNKGQQDLIRALNHLPDEVLRKMAVFIIGGGSAREIAQLKKSCRNHEVLQRVIFTGYLPGDSWQIIAQLDLLVVLTRDFEGFGYTVAEAMGVGVPVLATRVGGIPEFVQDFRSGRLIEPNSPVQAAEALKDFIRHPEAWRLRAESAQKEIRRFSKEVMAAEFYSVLLPGRGHAPSK